MVTRSESSADEAGLLSRKLINAMGETEDPALAIFLTPDGRFVKQPSDWHTGLDHEGVLARAGLGDDLYAFLARSRTVRMWFSERVGAGGLTICAAPTAAQLERIEAVFFSNAIRVDVLSASGVPFVDDASAECAELDAIDMRRLKGNLKRIFGNEAGSSHG